VEGKKGRRPVKVLGESPKRGGTKHTNKGREEGKKERE